MLAPFGGIANIHVALRAEEVGAQTPLEIEARMAVVLVQRCVSCHHGEEAKGGLDLSQRASALRGGDSGPAVVPGDAEASLVWDRVDAEEMPPEHPLTEEELQLFHEWIEAGAGWTAERLDPFAYSSDLRAGYDWWAYQPLADSELVYHPGQSPHPIDYFVDQRLAAAGLSRAPPADRRVLLRRLSIDLHGLPPTPQQRDAFLMDMHDSAYSRLVDRMLESPEYGQRWARHWLDVARFGESQGFERDKLRSNSWRYRDWVVSAFNDDMPYDEFVRLQLAGDVLYPQDPQAVIATGFLVAAPYDEVGQNQQSQAMRAVVRQDELEDLVSTVAQTFLGLTANCARCHDHKFDPIFQREYYQLTAALAGVHHGEPEIAVDEGDREIARRKEIYAARIQQLTKQMDALASPPNDRAEEETDSQAAAVEPALDDRTRELRKQLTFELEQLKDHQRRLVDSKVYAVSSKEPHPVHLLERGNPATPAAQVVPAGIAAIGGVSPDFDLPADASDAQRRVALSHWITSADNPLFARVIANRVWHYHFGVGIVSTPNDFGFNGGRPSHPQLLDWLAAELIRGGWSLKRLHRCILNSETYKQSSKFRTEAAEIDQDNRLLWRMNPQRLDAEVLRDALLLFAGQLDRSLGGPGFYEFETHVHNSQFYAMRDAVGDTFQRRALYRTWVRSARSNLLDVFDCPDPSTKAPQRAVTTTPLQALSLLNNSFVLRMAHALADRIQQQAPRDIPAQVGLVYHEVLGREPTDEEQRAAVEFVHQASLFDFCRVLFNCNELLYVD